MSINCAARASALPLRRRRVVRLQRDRNAPSHASARRARADTLVEILFHGLVRKP
jgi:hypothetical protein